MVSEANQQGHKQDVKRMITTQEKPRLTQKQETFCLKYFELGNATEAALIAGYKPKTARFIASENLTKPNIQVRIQELRQKVEDASVMDVRERQQRLTEIARAKLTDFMELGLDGSWVNIGQETPQGGAIQEIHSRTEYDKDGANLTVYTSVKLHDPMKAIDLLNRMDKIYSDPSVFVDNRKIEIYDAKGKLAGIIDRIASKIGEDPGPQLTDG